MKRDQTEQEGCGELMRLWICRMFGAGNMERLVGKRDFGDIGVARVLRLCEGQRLTPLDYDPQVIRHEVEQLRCELEARSESIRPPRRWMRNLQAIGRVLGLSTSEQQVLLLVCLRFIEPVLGDAFDLLREMRKREYLGLVAHMLRLPMDEVFEAASARGKLVQTGLIRWSPAGKMRVGLEILNPEVAESLLSESFSVEAAIRTIASVASPPTLALGDFPHLKETLGYLRRYLGDVLRRGARGVNIYLHGMPGTGKSELARVLARALYVRLYEVSVQDEDGDPITGDRRLRSLRLAQALLSGRPALLAFDEAEDVFTGSPFSRSPASLSKGWMNRLMENNSVPILWLSNACRGMDPAFLRRFDFVFEVATPPRAQRIRTFRRICADSVGENALRRLASCEFLAPAVVARANSVVQRALPEEPKFKREQALLHLVGHTLAAQGHHATSLDTRVDRVPKVFGLEFLQSDPPLAEIARGFNPRASCRMCLHGPPGTGKTTFGHWLARKLGLPLRVIQASDLLSPFVGQSEKAIAHVFREASESHSVLMIDEVDSFLHHRRHAVRAWEVSLVNEFLTRMEQFEGIFIASTNRLEGLDPAALRRFDLKVKFGYLREDQAKCLLKRHCRSLRLRGLTADHLEGVARLRNLTPGDLCNVSRQHLFRRFADAGAFLQAAVDECRLKEGGPVRSVGF